MAHDRRAEEGYAVRVERRGHVGLVVLNRPDRGNALSFEMLVESLPAAWQELGEDEGVRAVVLTGAGQTHFCTGADLRDPDIADVSTGRGSAPAMAFAPKQQGMFTPVICAVNGTCAGGALAFLADSDIVVAASNASFTNPGVSVGIQATLGPVGLVHRADFALLVRLTILGRHGQIDAATAHHGGLVDEVVAPERLLDRALELAAQVASNSPTAVQAALRSLWEARGRNRDVATATAMERIVAFRDHPDASEGRDAWMAGRAPQWSPTSGGGFR